MKNFYSPVMAISSTMVRRMAMPITIRMAMLSMVPDMVVIIICIEETQYRRKTTIYTYRSIIWLGYLSAADNS